MTYSYTVTNNSDLFDWTGDVVDDRSLGVVPRTSRSARPSATDDVTATTSRQRHGHQHRDRRPGRFNDPPLDAARTTAAATVTGHDCTISVTKTAVRDRRLQRRRR